MTCRRPWVIVVVGALLLGGCAGSSPVTPPPAVPSGCRPATAARSDLARLDRLSLSAHQMELAAPVPQRAITRPAVRRRLATQIAAARGFAASVPTVRDAKRRGYVLTLAPEAGSGAHWTNWSLVNCTFDAGRPSQILYDGVTDDARVVALSYLLVHRRTPPRGFLGPNAIWHQHFGLCLVHGELLPRPECNADGRLLDGRDLWMLHAWVVPQWKNPWGVFVPLNPRRIAGGEGAGPSPPDDGVTPGG